MTPSELIATLNDRGSSTPEWAIDEYERQLGVGLPEEYRSFLLNCNGGVSQELVCKWKVPPYTDYYGVRRDTMTVDVYHVYGFREEEWCSLETRNAWLAKEIPPSVIWIMDTLLSTGRWCLGIKGKYRDNVYFWDNDGTYPDGIDENISEFYLAANSFTEFVEKISIVEE